MATHSCSVFLSPLMMVKFEGWKPMMVFVFYTRKSYKKASGSEHAFCVRIKICSKSETKMRVVLGRGECWIMEKREIYLKHSFSGLSNFNSNVKTESNDEMIWQDDVLYTLLWQMNSLLPISNFLRFTKLADEMWFEL